MNWNGSCEKLQEAIQTGNEAGIVASVRLIVGDKTVNATARQNARYYIDRDKPNKYAQERTQFFCDS